jgi:hypothetical protein
VAAAKTAVTAAIAMAMTESETRGRGRGWGYVGGSRYTTWQLFGAK